MYGQVFFSFNDLFMLDLDYLSSYVACSNTTNTLNWHAWLRHISKKKIARLVRKGLLRCLFPMLTYLSVDL